MFDRRVQNSFASTFFSQPQEPLDDAYLAKLQNKGLTERGLRRMKLKSPDGLFATQEKRCRIGSSYVKYFKEVEPELQQKSLDFRMKNAEVAAKAEDIVMIWANIHGKGRLNSYFSKTSLDSLCVRLDRSCLFCSYLQRNSTPQSLDSTHQTIKTMLRLWRLSGMPET